MLLLLIVGNRVLMLFTILYIAVHAVHCVVKCERVLIICT